MDFGVDFHGICLNEIAAGFIVAFRLDALHLGEQLAKEAAEALIVVDAYEGLAVDCDVFNYVFGLAFFIYPLGNELAVAHVSFLYVLARLDAHELGHEAVEDVFVIFGFVCLGIVEDAELDEFGIGEVVERKEVGARFFEGGAVGFEGVGVDTGEQTAGTVTEALVEVGVLVVGDEEVLVEKVAGGLVDNEFFVEAVAVRSLVVSLGDVFKGD